MKNIKRYYQKNMFIFLQFCIKLIKKIYNLVLLRKQQSASAKKLKISNIELSLGYNTRLFSKDRFYLYKILTGASNITLIENSIINLKTYSNKFYEIKKTKDEYITFISDNDETNIINKHYTFFDNNITFNLNAERNVLIQQNCTKCFYDIYYNKIENKNKNKNKLNIVLVLDAVTRNYLFEKSSNISVFFEDGINFENAYSQSEWTLPSFVSMAQSQFTSNHNVIDPEYFDITRMSENNTTMAEAFLENGYATLGCFSHSRCNQVIGHERGYLEYIYEQYNKKNGIDANFIVDNAVEFILKYKDINQFLFLHFFDSHVPFSDSNKKIKLLPNECEFNATIYDIEKDSIEEYSEAEQNNIKNAYINEIEYIDKALVRLFECINQLNNYDVNVILTADHGFSNLTPSSEDQNISNETLNVPFLIKSSNKKFIDKLDSHNSINAGVDIFPTLLELNKIKYDLDTIDGVSIEQKKDITVSESIYKEKYKLRINFKNEVFILKAQRNRNNDTLVKLVYINADKSMFINILQQTKLSNKIKNQIESIL